MKVKRMRRPNGAKPSKIVRLFLTPEQIKHLEALANKETRSLANMTTVLVIEGMERKERI